MFLRSCWEGDESYSFWLLGSLLFWRLEVHKVWGRAGEKMAGAAPSSTEAAEMLEQQKNQFHCDEVGEKLGCDGLILDQTLGKVVLDH